MNLNKSLLGIGTLGVVGGIAGTVLMDPAVRSVTMFGTSLGFACGHRLFSRFIDKHQNQVITAARSLFLSIIFGILSYDVSNTSLPERCNIEPDLLSCSFVKNFQSINKFATACCAIYLSCKALATYYNREQVLKTWIVDLNEIQLIRKGMRLEYAIIDIPTKKEVKRGSIPSNWYFLDKIIEKIKRCQVILEDWTSPVFAVPLHVWEFEDKEISLLRTKEGLMLNLFNKSTQENLPSKFSCSSTMKFKQYISDASRIDFTKLESLSDQECRKVCQTIKVAEIDIREDKSKRFPRLEIYRSNLFPFLISFLPIKVQSVIDKRISLSHNWWGVTLIRKDGIFDNHALIVIEGMRNGKYFMEIADFMGKKGVPIRYEVVDQNCKDKDFKKNPEEIEYVERSSIWKRPRSYVEKMIEKIQEEKKCLDEILKSKPKNNNKKVKIPFSRLGCDSYFNNGEDSCITWARKKLQIAEIKLKNVAFDKVVAITELHTHDSESFKESAYPEFGKYKYLVSTDEKTI